jgi:hypothetical protein
MEVDLLLLKKNTFQRNILKIYIFIHTFNTVKN